MRTFLLKLLIVVICAFSTFSSFAQDVKSIEKQNKALIKSLKKQHKFKDINVVVENDGYWYFLLIGKDKTLGVANQDGKIIIPIGNNLIDYFPAEQEGIVKTGISNVGNTNIKMGFAYAYEASQPLFLIHNKNYSIVSLDGNILIDNIRQIRKTYGYWLISTSNEKIKSNHDTNKYSVFGFSGRNIGLIRGNGEILVKPEYESIILGCAFQPNEEAKLEELDDIRLCRFSKKNDGDGVVVEGAITLDNSLPPLPCSFNSIRIGEKYTDDAGLKKIWIVKKTKLGSYEEYTGNGLNDKYRDDGEKLFEQGNYEQVVKYYSKEGILQPWAKFYSGVSFMYLGLSNTSIVRMQTEYIENNNWQMYDFLAEKGSTYDFDLAKKQYETAIGLLKSYLNEDSTFKSQAESHIKMCNSYKNEMPDLMQKYQNAMQKLEKKKQDDIKRQREAALKVQQQRTELMYDILNIFANALQGSLSSPASVNKGNAYKENTKSSMSYGKSTMSGSSDVGSSPSSTANTRKKVKCRACAGKGFWIDERISGEEKWCDRCRKSRKPHTHKACGSCDGKGWHY